MQQVVEIGCRNWFQQQLFHAFTDKTKTSLKIATSPKKLELVKVIKEFKKWITYS